MTVKSSITHANHADGTHTITVRVWFQVPPNNNTPSVHVKIEWDPEELELTSPAHYAPNPPTFLSAYSGEVLWASFALPVGATSEANAQAFEVKLQCAAQGPYDALVTGTVEVVNDRAASRRHSVLVGC